MDTIPIDIDDKHPMDAEEAEVAALVAEIETALLAGDLPRLAQAINVYDTIEALLDLDDSEQEEELMAARFGIVVSLAGWVPGVGIGVRKLLHEVDLMPAHFVGRRDDMLRMVLMKAGASSSAQEVLAKLFDTAPLRALLGTVHAAVTTSWLYLDMAEEDQQAVAAGLAGLDAAIAGMVAEANTALAPWINELAAVPPAPGEAMRPYVAPPVLSAGTLTIDTVIDELEAYSEDEDEDGVMYLLELLSGRELAT